MMSGMLNHFLTPNTRYYKKQAGWKKNNDHSPCYDRHYV